MHCDIGMLTLRYNKREQTHLCNRRSCASRTPRGVKNAGVQKLDAPDHPFRHSTSQGGLSVS
jgi:hypothetical protein